MTPDEQLHDPKQLLEMVVDALRLVSLPADEQVAVLTDFVHVPDEVALLYDDAWRLVPQIREAGLITDEQYEVLARLDRHHEEMSKAPKEDSLWTIQAMREDKRWEEGRRLAVEALATLGRELGRPSFCRQHLDLGERNRAGGTTPMSVQHRRLRRHP